MLSRTVYRTVTILTALLMALTAAGRTHKKYSFMRSDRAWKRVYANRRLWASLPATPSSDELHRSLQWRAAAMKDEHGTIAADALYRANVDRRNFLHGHSPSGGGALLGSASWTSRGPTNVGGRTRALLVHPSNPNILYAGATAGGVWKSVDAGTTWQPLADFMSNLAISSLAFDGVDPNVLYAGTGELTYESIQGAGIFRSNDGGNTWSRLQSTSGWRYVQRIVTIPGQPGVVLAAADGGIYRSTNGGNSWGSAVAAGEFGFSIVLDPSSANNVIAVNRYFLPATERYEYRILRSTNGGQSFTQVSHPPLAGPDSGIALAYAASAPAVVYAHVGVFDGSFAGQVWKSTNGGQSFAVVSNGDVSDCSVSICSIWVDPVDPSFLVLGSNTFATSTDGGAHVWNYGYGNTLSSDIHADLHTIVASPLYNGTSNRVVYVGTDGGIFRAADIRAAGIGLDSWTSLNHGYQTSQFYSAAGTTFGTRRFIGGTQDNGTLYTSDLSNEAGMTLAGDGGIVAIDRVDPSIVYTEYVFLRLARSTDNGTSATYIDAPPDATGGNAAFIAPFVLDPFAPRKMIAGGRTLWRTQDATATPVVWEAIRPRGGDIITALAIAPTNPNVIWVAQGDGTITRTMSGTAPTPVWQTVYQQGTPGVLPSRMPTSIVIDPNDENTVYITYGGYVYDNIWKTANSGITWNSLTGVSTLGWPRVPVRALAIHPRNRNVLYAGTEVGVWESSDGGNSWSTTDTGPSDAPIYDLSFVPGTDTLLAGTYGRGLWTANTSTVVTYAPVNLTATAVNGAISVSWTAFPNASGYELVRSGGGGADTVIPVNSTSYLDGNVSSGAAYVYRARALVGGASTGLSNPDLAVNVAFTDDGTLPGKVIRALHLQELRTAVNAVMSAAHLPAPAYSAAATVRMTDINQLRTALLRAFRSIGVSDTAFGEEINELTLVRAAHFQELRDRMR